MADIIKINGMSLVDVNAVRSINDMAPDERGNLSVEGILFAAFVEEGIIQPVYDDESAVFADENGVMFVYDPVNQNVKVTSGQSSITVNGIEPDANGNIAVKFTINGIEPDENGNIELKPADSLKISLWAKEGDWVKNSERDAIIEGFKKHLASIGKLYGDLNIVWEKTRTDGYKVADMGAAVNAAGDFDIIIGCGANVTTAGGVEVIEKADIPVSRIAAGRMAALLTKNELAIMLYGYVTQEDGGNVELPIYSGEYEVI